MFFLFVFFLSSNRFRGAIKKNNNNFWRRSREELFQKRGGEMIHRHFCWIIWGGEHSVSNNFLKEGQNIKLADGITLRLSTGLEWKLQQLAQLCLTIVWNIPNPLFSMGSVQAQIDDAYDMSSWQALLLITYAPYERKMIETKN
jgi:hypothetical protein